MDNKELKISEEYLAELIDYTSRSLVGKLLKRYEVVDNKEIVKALSKELIYEQFRNFRDLLVAHSKGLDITQFKFKKPGDTSAN